VIDKKIRMMQLKELAGLGSTTLAKLSKDEPVSMDVMARICKVLECNIGDVMDILPDKE
jgi:DNA-binding Xre family transcriptional regulator